MFGKVTAVTNAGAKKSMPNSNLLGWKVKLKETRDQRGFLRQIFIAHNVQVIALDLS